MYLSPRLSGLQKGIGLPAAIFIIVVLALLAVAINQLLTDNSENFIANYLSTRAFYAAESGAQIGMTRLFANGVSGEADAGDSDSDGDGVGTCGDSFFVTSLPADPADDSVVSVDFRPGTPGLEQCFVLVTCSPQSLGSSQSFFNLTSRATCGGGAELATRTILVRAQSTLSP